MVFSKNKISSSARRTVIKLAPGVRLIADAQRPEAVGLLIAGGTVQLNDIAAAILELCDGSMSREAVVVGMMRRAGVRSSTSDVNEFLQAALARGWLTES